MTATLPAPLSSIIGTNEGLTANVYSFPENVERPFYAIFHDTESENNIGVCHCPTLEIAETTCKKWMGLIASPLPSFMV